MTDCAVLLRCGVEKMKGAFSFQNKGTSSYGFDCVCRGRGGRNGPQPTRGWKASPTPRAVGRMAGQLPPQARLRLDVVSIHKNN